MAKIGRNDRCPCGSGKKYKQCCLAKDEVAERTAREQHRAVATTQAPDHLPHHHPHFCKDCNAEIDDAANTVIALIDAGKLDKAEHAAQAIVERWPDIYDGYDCLGMVCHARGDKQVRPPAIIARSSALLVRIPVSTMPSSRITTRR
jgi:hypothetical protein